MQPAGVINQRVVDRLLSDRRISGDAHSRALDYVARHGGRVEDVLIELDVISEPDLLRFISLLHGTRFVSTEKLYQAKIDKRVVAKVPRKLAMLHAVFPVMWDERKRSLTVVTADPDNDLALQELRLAARAQKVSAFVARPAAVQAAIARAYQGDASAFASLMRSQGGYLELGDPGGRADRQSDRPSPGYQYRPSSKPPPPPVEKARQAPVDPGRGGLDLDIAVPRGRGDARHGQDTRNDGGFDSPRVPAFETSERQRRHPTSEPPEPAPRKKPSRTGSAPLGFGESLDAPVAVEPTATAEYIETLNILISLMEVSRADLRGHSAMVARLIRKTCERMELSEKQTNDFVLAGYLHDLGKAGAYHQTALNVAEYEGHRVAAQKAVEMPSRLMESVGLPRDTLTAMQQMYERYDGDGFPQGLSSKDIALGARILAVVDTYGDLTQNPRNPYRKILRPAQACDVLSEFRESIFDPNIVDLFRQAMTGDDLRAKLLEDRHRVLVADPDPEETTVLELRLIEQGFEVRIARTLEQATKELSQGEYDVVVSEIDLDVADAGVTLRGTALRESWGQDLVWIVLTRKRDKEVAQIVFDLGVDDFIAKPASPEILSAKVRQLMERKKAKAGPSSAVRGVSGSLTEMGLPDMVQILWHGRKTCALRIRSTGKTGEILFSEGQIFDASFESLGGEDAFYEMLKLTEGDFQLEPNVSPGERTIQASPEALLLEGMRRLDEGGDPFGR